MCPAHIPLIRHPKPPFPQSFAPLKIGWHYRAPQLLCLYPSRLVKKSKKQITFPAFGLHPGCASSAAFLFLKHKEKTCGRMRLCRYKRNGKIKVMACRKGFSAREDNLRGFSVHISGYWIPAQPAASQQRPREHNKCPTQLQGGSIQLQMTDLTSPDTAALPVQWKKNQKNTKKQKTKSQVSKHFFIKILKKKNLFLEKNLFTSE